ncbi:hypothetical protein [Streptomyces sp. NPDC090029]|uniref:hypothetical protein n=1 Tax=Streptomyces sp. NPDC090029 TaxID=3365924 RepID=UPI00382F77CD
MFRDDQSADHTDTDEDHRDFECTEGPAHEGHSKNHGVYASIGASTNDGNKKTEGVAADQ